MSRQRLSPTALLVLLAVPVFAQRFTAAIRGDVTDPSKAVIVGAKVTLRNEETGLARTATTNEAANYSFADLPVGTYQAEAASSGFRSAVRADLALWQHDRSSIYHGLQIALNSWFGHGSVLAIAYSWSKLIATGAMDNSNGGFDANLAYRDSAQPNLDRSLGGTDRTHMFNASLVLALPTLQDKSSLVRNALGDWEFTTIVQAATGYPVTVGAWVPGLNGPSGTSSWQLHTPNRVVGQPCAVSTTHEPQWLNPAAFTFDGYEIGTNGTTGRNICSGPGLFQADASLYKNIKLGSAVKLQLRFEVFNLFDSVNFLGYSLNTGYVVNDVVFDTGNPATATKILSATPPGNFGQLSAARDPRTLQLGIRLAF